MNTFIFMRNILLAILLFAVLPVAAQNDQKEALDVDCCPFDKDANAFVLFADMDMRMERWRDVECLRVAIKKQIKILKEDGTGAGDVEVVIYDDASSDTDDDEVLDIKASSINVVDGKVEVTEMTKKMISQQRIDDKRVSVRFAIPQVKVGSVIKYSYSIYRRRIYDIPSWLAQDKYPVKSTHCSIQMPGYVGYYYEQTGSHKVTMDKRETMNETRDVRFDFSYYDLPALPKNADYIYCPMDYADKIDFEVMEVLWRGQRHNFTKSQNDVNRLLFTSKEFGGRLRQSNPLKEEMEALNIKAIPDVMERIEATIALLKSRLRWNGKYALVGTSLSKVLKEGSGDNADLNFVLMSMLKDAGVDCYPAVMSRRSRGKLPANRPSIDALNTFVVAIAENPTTMHYYDCSAENGYLDILPAELNVDRAFILYKTNKFEEVNLQKVVSQRTFVNITAELTAEGKMTGKCVYSLSGIAAMNFRNKWFEKNDSAAFVADIEAKNGISISQFHTTGTSDFSKSATYEYDFTIDYGESDEYYFRPFIMPFFNENPFTEETPIMPKEFPALSSSIMSLDIKLPEGYYLQEGITPVNLALPGNTLDGILGVKEINSHIQANCRVRINKLHFSIDEYPPLKEFFERMETTCGKMIVVGKK